MHFAKPEVLLHIMDVCKRRDSQSCWLTVGTLAQRIHLKLQDFENNVENEQVSEILEKVSRQLHEKLQGLSATENVDASESNIKKDEDILTYLKTVRNMGIMYLELVPEAAKLLIDFAKEPKFSTHVRAAVLQLKKFLLRTWYRRKYLLENILMYKFMATAHDEVRSTDLNCNAGSIMKSLEGIAVSLHKMFSQMKFEPYTFSEVYESLTKFLQLLQTRLPQESVEYNFDQSIVENIKKLGSSYRKFSPKMKPFMNAYVNLFGSTVSFLTSGDLTKLLSNVNELYQLLDDMKNGMRYDTTRVFRIIEAYHQVPTMMGLPLNWTTNATFAFSLRSGLKAAVNPKEFKVLVAGDLQPSVALTFLNRMVVDLPTVTQIGVQANSSAYSSTQWKAELNATPTKFSFRIEKPPRTQSVLELFRTNQLIKHDKYIDIPDWDIERTSSSWCTGSDINSIIGMQLCIQKSYPKVTHLIKPWALMAGWCKWQCQIRPFNNKVQFYEINLKNSLEAKKKTVDLELSAKGDSVEKKLSFNFNMEQSNDGSKFEIKSGSLPDFVASIKSKSVKKNQKTGHGVASILRLSKGFQYKIDLTQEERIELLPDFSVQPNALEDDHKLTTVIQEQLLLLESPYNAYEWKKEHVTQGESTRTDVNLSYERYHI
ncbi:uncharacterized protein LOC129228202 [Uloborus diversus]|uniref:uncharacterized protein LOC129228202 n=1 Tax=Uloborus diversus TaxID=327109 RepID=UPI00240A7A8F|nr:uncharacterized protein LOC129228202 [Uloborus diversus]